MNEEDKKKPGLTGGWIWATFLCLVIYVLSLGPAARWYSKQPSVRPVLRWVYAPLELLEKTPLKKPLHSYSSWWLR